MSYSHVSVCVSRRVNDGLFLSLFSFFVLTRGTKWRRPRPLTTEHTGQEFLLFCAGCSDREPELRRMVPGLGQMPSSAWAGYLTAHCGHVSPVTVVGDKWAQSHSLQGHWAWSGHALAPTKPWLRVSIVLCPGQTAKKLKVVQERAVPTNGCPGLTVDLTESRRGQAENTQSQTQGAVCFLGPGHLWL